MKMIGIKEKYKSNELVINNKSSFKSQLVRCQAIMDNIYFDELVLRAMGKATCRAVNLALQLNLNNYETFELKTSTYTVEILEDKSKKPIHGVDLDNFDPEKVDITSKKVTQIPAIEIIVRKNQLELNRIQKIKNQPSELKSR